MPFQFPITPTLGSWGKVTLDGCPLFAHAEQPYGFFGPRPGNTNSFRKAARLRTS